MIFVISTEGMRLFSFGKTFPSANSLTIFKRASTFFISLLIRLNEIVVLPNIFPCKYTYKNWIFVILLFSYLVISNENNLKTS